ncbi:MAG: 2-dehydro-3-deoxygalactonokinase [Myxococcota bacterium]|nr:2-dehydro-3-deoxygalactonokinase [Myxococcota bacterium]
MNSVPLKRSALVARTQEHPASIGAGEEDETASDRSDLPATAALLGVDWGSTAVRAVLLDRGGNVVASDRLDAGVRSARGRACEQVFDLVTSRWMDDLSDLPVLLTGMVGSAQGWREAPYTDCPADLEAIASGLVQAPRANTWIVPGVAGHGISGAPDVMRGEETQLLGLEGDGAVLLPGTHTKWANLEQGKITQFTTCITGETFELLRDPGLIGAVMSGTTLDEAAFRRGLADLERPGGLLHHIFTVRSRALRGDLDSEAAWSYAWGLLIGSEVDGMTRALHLDEPVRIVGTAGLSALYRCALQARGIEAECIAGQEAAGRGLIRIARAAGLIGSS